LFVLVGVLALGSYGLELAHADTTIISGTIVVTACEDWEADGICSDDNPPLEGATVELESEDGTLLTATTPATFTNLTYGAYTATLRLDGPYQGYYPTIAPVRINLPQCQCDCGCSNPDACGCQCDCACWGWIKLGAVYPIHPKGVAVHRGLNKVYVAFQGPYSPTLGYRPYPFVTVFDGATNEAIRTIPGGRGGVAPDGEPGIGVDPWGVALSRDEKHLYVTAHEDGLISVIDPYRDVVLSNITATHPFSPSVAVTNPMTDLVHIPDYKGGRVVFVSGQQIVHELRVIDPPQRYSPFELAIARAYSGYNFLTLRDVFLDPPFIGRFSLGKFETPTSASPNPGVGWDFLSDTVGSPHAIAIWEESESANQRLFVTATSNKRDLQNPNRILIYGFSTSYPTALGFVDNVALNRDYVEVGLLHIPDKNHMIGTYNGFLYSAFKKDENGQLTYRDPCTTTVGGQSALIPVADRGGNYALTFDGTQLADAQSTAKAWRVPQIAMGNPPLITTTLQWFSPFEVAYNPDNNTVYTTDRCWGAGRVISSTHHPEGGAVLVFSDTVKTLAPQQPGSAMQNIYLPFLMK
jgi:DNA-binding beta-propeller fold protein YncE